MKSRLFLLAALFVALASVGCNKEPETPAVDYAKVIVGQWHCAPEGYDVDVYVSFEAEGTFNEYQRLGDGGYRHYTGTWSVEKDVLSGVYSDGVEWGSSYTISFDGANMILTATNDSAEAMTYVQTTIPDDVKNSAIAPFALRSGDIDEADSRWF